MSRPSHDIVSTATLLHEPKNTAVDRLVALRLLRLAKGRPLIDWFQPNTNNHASMVDSLVLSCPRPPYPPSPPPPPLWTPVRARHVPLSLLPSRPRARPTGRTRPRRSARAGGPRLDELRVESFRQSVPITYRVMLSFYSPPQTVPPTSPLWTEI